MNMRYGEFDDIAPEIDPGSVDLIFTDPPYPRAQATPCFELLAKWAPVLLKRGGSLVTITPHYFLEEAVSILKGALKFRWIYDMDQEDGPHPRMAMGIEVCWKPMLHYVQGAYPQGRGFLKDKIKIPGPEKELHEWQQAEAWGEYYIEKLTDPGDFVVDPFCGPGTVPAICKRLRRNALGIERDREVYDAGVRRLLAL
jgi:DNA modification methylase